MARSELKPITVYASTDAQITTLEKAAGLDNRSLSNFLLTAGLEKAREMGVSIATKVPEK